MGIREKAVVTVIGKDCVGILAKTSAAIAEVNGNVIEVTQQVMEDMFTMIMLIEVHELVTTIEELENKLKVALPTLEVHVMHERIFDSMHRI